MYRRIDAWNLRIFVIAQVAILMIALRLDYRGAPPEGWLLRPVLAVQFALLGLWLGAADAPLGRRLASTIGGAVVLLLLWLRRPDFNSWELLMFGVQFPVLAGVFGWLRRARGVVLSDDVEQPTAGGLRLTIAQMLAVMLYVAVFLAVVRLLSAGFSAEPWYQLLLVFVIASVGVLHAVICLTLAAALLGGQVLARSCLYAAAVVVFVAVALAGFDYSQTDSQLRALRTLAITFVEAAVAVGSLLLWRGMEIRLRHVAAQSPSPLNEGEADLKPASPAKLLADTSRR